MKADAWECGHRMPFIVRWPNKVKPGSVSPQTICFTDLLATFAAIVGAELSASAGPDSFDFSRVLLAGEDVKQPIRSSLVIRSGAGVFTIRSGDWKLITALGSGGFSKPRKIKPRPDDPKGQLYNLANDLGETRNLYKEQPNVVKRLMAELATIREADRSRPLVD